MSLSKAFTIVVVLLTTHLEFAVLLGPCSGISCLIGCGIPKDFPYRRIRTLLPGRSYSIGDRIAYVCETGFRHRSGSPHSRCLADGTWSVPTMKCVSVCRPPPYIANTTHDDGTNGVFSGSVVSYKCLNGYSSGNIEEMKLVCSSEVAGNWRIDGKCLQCKKMCKPFQIMNGNAKPNGCVAYNHSVTITCELGYTLHSQGIQTCSTDGQWTGDHTECRETQCSSLSSPSNGNVEDNDTSVGSVVKYTCNKGYRLNGEYTRTCLTNGSWAGEKGICQAINCGPLSIPYGNCTFSKNTSYDSVARCTCDEGFRLVGRAESRCNDSGNWSPIPPLCKRTDADLKKEPQNATTGRLLDTYGRPDTTLLTAHSGLGFIGVAVSLTAAVTCILLCVFGIRCKQKSSTNDPAQLQLLFRLQQPSIL